MEVELALFAERRSAPAGISVTETRVTLVEAAADGMPSACVVKDFSRKRKTTDWMYEDATVRVRPSRGRGRCVGRMVVPQCDKPVSIMYSGRVTAEKWEFACEKINERRCSVKPCCSRRRQSEIKKLRVSALFRKVHVLLPAFAYRLFCLGVAKRIRFSFFRTASRSLDESARKCWKERA